MRDCPFRSDDCSDDDTCSKHLECLTRDLAAREAKLLNFWKYSRDVQCILSQEGRILDISPACFIQLGYQAEELVGRLFTDIVHPQDVLKSSNIVKSLISHQVSHLAHITRVRHANGHYINVEWCSSAPVDGNVYATARVLSTAKLEAPQRNRTNRELTMAKVS